MMREYIIPELIVIDLEMEGNVLQDIITSGSSEEEWVKVERDFYEESPSTPSKGSIWDNEW